MSAKPEAGDERGSGGLINVQKAHLLLCCAYNLGLVMRKCFGMSKPRSGAAAVFCLLILSAVMAYRITGPNLGVGYFPWLIPGLRSEAAREFSSGFAVDRRGDSVCWARISDGSRDRPALPRWMDDNPS